MENLKGIKTERSFSNNRAKWTIVKPLVSTGILTFIVMLRPGVISLFHGI